MTTTVFGISYRSGKVNLFNILTKAFLTIMIFAFCESSYGQEFTCSSFIGKWQTPEKDIIQIYQSNGKFFGKLIELGEPNDENGNPWRDELNPDKTLRTRLVKGITILENLQCDSKENELIKGKVYLPEEGEKLSCSLKMLNAKQLEIKVSVGIFSDSEKWIKLK